MRGFAEPLEMAFSAFRSLENGTSPITDAVADAIQKCHGVSSKWLLSGEGAMMAGRPRAQAHAGKSIEVPRLSLEASAGDGSSLKDYVREVGSMSFDWHMLREICGVPPESLYMLKISGDSMQPTINHGELVFVDASEDQDFSRDGVWALRMRDKLCVKRVRRDAPEGQEVVSDNKDYRPVALDETVRLLGRVVGQLRRFF
jgi:phage repressor protein C with HTH and peptisase S24 domain